jgi:hypothetical protein
VGVAAADRARLLVRHVPSPLFSALATDARSIRQFANTSSFGTI